MLHFLNSANSTFFLFLSEQLISFFTGPTQPYTSMQTLSFTIQTMSGQGSSITDSPCKKIKKVTCFCIILTLNSLVMRNYALWNIKCFVEADHFTWETKNHIMIDFYIVWFSLCPLNVLSTLVKSLLMKTVYNVTDKRSFIW